MARSRSRASRSRSCTPERIREAGLGIVPEDRLRRALVADQTVEETISLGRHRQPPFARGRWLDFEGRRKRAQDLLTAYDVRPPDPAKRVGDLSGGNQQKVVIARELDRNPRAFLAVQPTRGLDIAAVAMVHRKLLDERERGTGILLVSLDLDEVLALADRVLVLYRGKLVGSLTRAEFDARKLGRWMLGHDPGGDRCGVTFARRSRRCSRSRSRSGSASCSSRSPATTRGSRSRRTRRCSGAASATSPGCSRAGRSPCSPAPGASRRRRSRCCSLCGLSVAVAFQVGLFNIGAQGQLIVGAITAAALGAVPLPLGPIHLLLCLFAAAAAGGLWAFFAAWLKVRRGVHEVISTIMLNWVAVSLVENWLVPGPLPRRGRGRASPARAPTEIFASAALPRLLGDLSRLNAGFPLALAIWAAVWVWLSRSVHGFESRAVGLAPDAARAAGMPVEKRAYQAMAASGALAGLAGAVLILGTEHSYPAILGARARLRRDRDRAHRQRPPDRGRPLRALLRSPARRRHPDAAARGAQELPRSDPGPHAAVRRRSGALGARALVPPPPAPPSPRSLPSRCPVLELVESLIFSTLDYAPALIFAALGAMISERSGVVNIAVEGMMRVAAFTAAVAALTYPTQVALLWGMAAGGLVGGIHAFLCVGYRSNQIISGMALNLVALAGVTFLLESLYSPTGTPAITQLHRWTLPGLEHVPVLRALSGHASLSYFALIVPFAIHGLLFRTPLGLRIRSVGEKPQAAATLGVSVGGLRTACVLASGVLAGLGGAALSVSTLDRFEQHMPAGLGFMAIAANVFGRWRPLGAFGAALFFAFANAVRIGLASSMPWLLEVVPQGVLLALPYLLTLGLLAIQGARAHAPAALGVPYQPEAR